MNAQQQSRALVGDAVTREPNPESGASAAGGR